MSGGDGWTIDELARQAAGALDAAGVGAPNGRVTAAPDRRTIRWYTTIGLVDPPLRTRGRTARYGERHLLQLLAIKRRQASGRSLTEIQAELAGAPDRTLRRIAGAAGAAAESGPAPAPPRPRFWAERPAPLALPGPVYPIALHPAATLTLTTAPTAGDLAAIHAAARPLLDTLATRGLLARPGTATPDTPAPDTPAPDTPAPDTPAPDISEAADRPDKEPA